MTESKNKRLVSKNTQSVNVVYILGADGDSWIHGICFTTEKAISMMELEHKISSNDPKIAIDIFACDNIMLNQPIKTQPSTKTTYYYFRTIDKSVQYVFHDELLFALQHYPKLIELFNKKYPETENVKTILQYELENYKKDNRALFATTL